jgi:hypothetical protein
MVAQHQQISSEGTAAAASLLIGPNSAVELWVTNNCWTFFFEFSSTHLNCFNSYKSLDAIHHYINI